MNTVLVLGRKSNSTRILIAELKSLGEKVIWIEEKRDDKFTLLRKRIFKYGFFTVLSQIMFMVYSRILTLKSRERIEDILKEYQPYRSLESVAKFKDINSIEAIKLINEKSSKLIILSGTRIISDTFLKNVSTPVVNIHAGITPLYRGVHGGYWALVNKEKNNFGSTIHYIDEGIDTGSVISYSYPELTSKDNFVTYPLIQQKAAAKSIGKLIPRIVNRESFVNNIPECSKLWTHPTIFEYFRNGVK